MDIVSVRSISCKILHHVTHIKFGIYFPCYIYIFIYLYLLGFGGGGPNLYISGVINRGEKGLTGGIKPGCRPLPIGGPTCPLIGTIGLTTIGLGGKL